MSLEINKRVAYYRQKKHYKQSYVAERMDMKGSSYSQMEREGNISAERIVKLAEILDVKIEWLLLGEPENKDVGSLESPKPEIPKPEPFILTNKEKSIIKIIRSLKKKERDEVIEFIQSKI